MMNQFCPLYKAARQAEPWSHATDAHAGLLFDKFAWAWDWKIDKEQRQPVEPRIPVFDVGDQLKKESDKQDSDKQGHWIRQFGSRKPGNGNMLREACDRQELLTDSQGGVVVYLTNTTRFVTGMGRNHPLENGFTWQHTLGVPYLPGTGVKGVLRAWLREQDDNHDVKGRLVDSKRVTDLFGSQEGASRVTLLDMLPTAPPQLAAEIMTPHYGPYYQDGETPGDWHSPIPISYLAVEKGATWQLGILPAPGQRAIKEQDVAQLKAALLEALDWLGAGAKTATGYGQFEEDKATAAVKHREAEERRIRQEAERQREKELRDLSPELAELVKRCHEAQWSSNTTAFLDGVEAYRNDVPDPTNDCVNWLREQLEVRWQGIWDNPDATKGRKQLPKHNKRGATLVRWLKDRGD